MLKCNCIHKVGDGIDQTKVFGTNELKDAMIEETLKDVYEILEDTGYNAINQMVGYLMSGDPGFITSNKEARSRITKYDRSKILEYLVRKSLQK